MSFVQIQWMIAIETDLNPTMSAVEHSSEVDIIFVLRFKKPTKTVQNDCIVELQ